jgi:uncharacterized UPF0146 family protein
MNNSPQKPLKFKYILYDTTSTSSKQTPYSPNDNPMLDSQSVDYTPLKNSGVDTKMPIYVPTFETPNRDQELELLNEDGGQLSGNSTEYGNPMLLSSNPSTFYLPSVLTQPLTPQDQPIINMNNASTAKTIVVPYASSSQEGIELDQGKTKYDQQKAVHMAIVKIIDNAAKSYGTKRASVNDLLNLDGRFKSKDIYNVIANTILFIKSKYKKYKDVSFVDIGCSEGSVLLVAALFDEISCVVGIERDSRALENYISFLKFVCTKLPLDQKKETEDKWRTKIRVIQGDAFDFTPEAYQKIDIIYSYSPHPKLFEFGIRTILNMTKDVKSVLYAPSPGANEKDRRHELGPPMHGRAAEYNDIQFGMYKTHISPPKNMVYQNIIPFNEYPSFKVDYWREKDDDIKLDREGKIIYKLKATHEPEPIEMYWYPISDSNNYIYTRSSPPVSYYDYPELSRDLKVPEIWKEPLTALKHIQVIMRTITTLLVENKDLPIEYIWNDGVDVIMDVKWKDCEYKGVTYTNGIKFDLKGVMNGGCRPWHIQGGQLAWYDGNAQLTRTVLYTREIIDEARKNMYLNNKIKWSDAETIPLVTSKVRIVPMDDTQSVSPIDYNDDVTSDDGQVKKKKKVVVSSEDEEEEDVKEKKKKNSNQLAFIQPQIIPPIAQQSQIRPPITQQQPPPIKIPLFPVKYPTKLIDNPFRWCLE